MSTVDKCSVAVMALVAALAGVNRALHHRKRRKVSKVSRDRHKIRTKR